MGFVDGYKALRADQFELKKYFPFDEGLVNFIQLGCKSFTLISFFWDSFFIAYFWMIPDLMISTSKISPNAPYPILPITL